jgi:hypothetical protein
MSVTIFSAPKPFTDPHIAMIQRNAIRSWMDLGTNIEVLLIGDDHEIDQAAAQLGATHVPTVDRNAQQTPLISSIFEQAQSQAQHSIVAYINTDILLMDDFLTAIEQVASQQSEYLIVGQRWDLDQETELEFEPGWEQALKNRLASEGSLHAPAGSDYFVFPRGQLQDLPPFALGRAGWDNWMIFNGRSLRIPVVDATEAITAVHQSHDYGHLEGGIPHYRLEESQVNVQLGGGPETVFTLADATWRMNGQGLARIPWPQGGIFRWGKSSLVARFSSPRSLRFLHAILHPLEFARSSVAGALRRLNQV